MKKKNGFTLIELLAVVIILGVLMIIAVSAVTKYINDSRKSTYSNYATATHAQYRTVVGSNVMINFLYGVRPVITVNIEELEQ